MHTTGDSPASAADVGTDELLDALAQLGRTQRIAAEQLAKELGWPRAGLSLLRMLRCTGPMSLSDVAAALQVDLSVASRHVTALADAGHVVRVVDPDDRRIRTVALTEAGRALAGRSSGEIAAATERVFGTWTADELAAAVVQLRRLTAAIGTTHDVTPHEKVGGAES